MADGLLGKCKECTKRDTKNRYVTSREKVRAYDKQREQTPHRKAKKLEYQRRRRLTPEGKANMMVTNAIARGEIVPQPCEVCGDTSAEAHHDDYSKPLEVRWLCFVHHREHHGQKVG